MGKEAFPYGRGWMILAISFILVSIGLSTYLVYTKEFEDSSSCEDKKGAIGEACILELYPDFFRTDTEQARFRVQYEDAIGSNRTQAPEDDVYPPRNCTYQCEDEILQRGRRAATDTGAADLSIFRSKRQATPDIFHGCCITDQGFIQPSSAQAVDGTLVTVVQFHGHHQYFYSETCRQANGCTYCRCVQDRTIVLAVVRYPKSKMVKPAYIYIPGCCKCYNTRGTSNK